MGFPVFFDSNCARFSCSESRASARRRSRRARSAGSTSLQAGNASLARAMALSASSSVAGSRLSRTPSVAGLIMSSKLGNLRYEGFYELAFLVFFGVPEHAEHEGTGGVFERLDRVIFGAARHDEPVADLPYALVMVGLYRRLLAPRSPGG